MASLFDDDEGGGLLLSGGYDDAMHSDDLSNAVVVDCEMVEVEGRKSALARVSLVAFDESVLYDSHVAPSTRVVDYRTRWSGVRPADLEGAPAFSVVQGTVARLVHGRVLIGHGIQNDLRALQLAHPPACVLDTQLRSHNRWSCRSRTMAVAYT